MNTNAHDLHRMLNQIAPHVSDDDTLPVITAVRIEAEGGNLFALATDRYTMAVARVGTVETENWQAYIPVESLPAVLAWLHVAGTSVTQVTADRDDNGNIALSLATASSNMRVTVDSSDYAHYPNWRKTIGDQLEADMEPVPMTSYTTEFLARWKDAGTVLHAWQAGPRKALVLADDDGLFLGLQMPVRFETCSREPLITQWLTAFKPTVTVDGVMHRLDEAWLDNDGDEWTFTGSRNPSGEPLMALVGLEDDTYTFAQAAAEYGLKPAA
ncbi:phiSA1p31-related protein [Streptomyces sp. ISL-94]|uniref:DNA polymerase III subunit beta family protein n=1 Tax=Streptomyces sp. ISL-94 TaxID=2819190 RepID=UPI001BE99C26|nr:phiSA1p31-related protein [Streptomyces sp. ISL-94]MBT2477590.1 phiSA1p31-related protein [Streptomyces sp. ISL-94]